MAQRSAEAVAGFIIEGLPPSNNTAIRHTNKGGRLVSYPSQEYQEWKSLCKLLKPQTIRSCTWYVVVIDFHLPLYYKNGKPRKKDLDGMIKYAIDGVIPKIEDSEGNPIDDSRIVSVGASKHDSPIPLTSITFLCAEE